MVEVFAANLCVVIKDSCQIIFGEETFTTHDQLASHLSCEISNAADDDDDNILPAPRIHQCDHCDKAFSEKGNLDVHKRTHTGVKPYECSLCGKKFATIGNKNDHERRHNGTKPYSCTQCNVKYYRRY